MTRIGLPVPRDSSHTEMCALPQRGRAIDAPSRATCGATSSAWSACRPTFRDERDPLLVSSIGAADPSRMMETVLNLG